MGQKPSDSNNKARRLEHKEATDEELMLNYQYGSHEAFEEIFGRYRGRLFRFIVIRAGSSKEHLSEEVFQKTWLKINTHRHSFNPTFKLSTWIYTIALNTLRDEVGSAHERVQFEELEEEMLEPVYQEDWFQKNALSEKIAGALKNISDKQREAVLLMNIEGFTSKEAAVLMGLTDGAVRQLLFRAHQNLKRILSHVESVEE